jgi:hypothetical protein
MQYTAPAEPGAAPAAVKSQAKYDGDVTGSIVRWNASEAYMMR